MINFKEELKIDVENNQKGEIKLYLSDLADFDIKNPYSVTDLSGNSQTVTFGGTEGVVSMAVSPAVTDDGRLFGTDYYYGYCCFAYDCCNKSTDNN